MLPKSATENQDVTRVGQKATIDQPMTIAPIKAA
jgi:hypothetical protein